jgi:hypothetical protein
VALRECLDRFDWAVHYLNIAESQMFAAFKPHDYVSWDVERKHRGQQREYTPTEIKEVPENLALLVGDCVHNFRACIDNLIYSLTWAHTKGKLTSAQRRSCAFPIGAKPSDFQTQVAKGAIANIPPRAQALIERLQPYHAVHPERHPLLVLKSLSDNDKHRTVPLIIWRANPIGYSPSVQGAKIVMGEEPLKVGTKFCTIKVPPAYAEVDVNMTFQFHITIEEPTTLRDRGVLMWLGDIKCFINDEIIKEMALASLFPDADDGALTRATGLVYPRRTPI